MSTWSTPLPWLMAWVGLAVCPVSALADEFRVDPLSESLSCLKQVEAPALVYPERELDAKQGAVVRVRITFKAPDQEPEVEVIGNTGGNIFGELAVRRARAYRLPCLKAGEPIVIATQEYSFVPTDGRPVAWGPPEQDGAEYTRCVMLDGQALPWKRKPDYPSKAVRDRQSGLVLTRMTFVSATQPPQIEVLFDSGNRHFRESVVAFLADVRLPCLPAGQQVSATQSFDFAFDGVPIKVPRDLTLGKFVGAMGAKLDAPANKVRFDLSAMGCPFDVRFVLYQPYLSNSVGEVGRRDERRTQFLDWLRKVNLDVPKADMKYVLGETITISVPCGLLDLT